MLKRYVNVYVNKIDLVTNIQHETPIFGDHELIMAEVNIIRPKAKTTFRRNWCKYTKEKLENELGLVDWSNDSINDQEIWNDFELKLVDVIDRIAPICEFKGDSPIKGLNHIVKNKLNLRNRLLKHLRIRPTLELKNRIKNLNFEIKTHFYSETKN